MPGGGGMLLGSFLLDPRAISRRSRLSNGPNRLKNAIIGINQGLYKSDFGFRLGFCPSKGKWIVNRRENVG